jgi:photosystem II stability/assembly factor-like uncharacterized protein
MSVTFVGNGSGYLGAVLGRAACAGSSCLAMAGTASYANSWTRVGAPPAALNSVTQVRFANSRNGWAYGPALYATHNGGMSWRRISQVTGRLVDLATVDNQVLAVTATGCTGAGTVTSPGTAYAANCTGFALYAATVTSNHFVPVLSRPRGGLVTPGGLQLQPVTHAGYLIAGGRLYSGTLDGSGWVPVPPESAANPGCLTGKPTGSPAVLAPAASELYAVCPAGQQLELYRSASSGRTWQTSGRIPAAGIATSLAISPAGTLMLATTHGLYYAVDAKTWTHVTSGSADGMGFGYVGMTTNRLGVAVPSQPGKHELFITTDGGRTWQPKRISR